MPFQKITSFVKSESVLVMETISTNLGGLGTLIASMASLITYRFYAQRKEAKNGRYLVYFSLLNVAFLVILYLFYVIL